MHKIRRYDYYGRRLKIRDMLGVKDEEIALISMYKDEGMSAIEISEKLRAGGIVFNPKSIQRIMQRAGVVRSTGDAYRLAAKRGRIQWALKDPRFKARGKQVQGALRLSILKRDAFRCVLCGADAKATCLEVDHIIARCNGGTNEPDNLRTLCHECNVGKRVLENEK